MNSVELSILLAWEMTQLVAVLFCLLVNIRTLSAAVRWRGDVRRDKESTRAAFVWTNNNVRGKATLSVANFVMSATRAHRTYLLLTGYVPELPRTFVVFGMAYLLVSLMVAWCAWENIKDFRGLGSNP